MKTYLYVLTMLLGVVLTVHLAMNGKVGAVSLTNVLGAVVMLAGVFLATRS